MGGAEHAVLHLLYARFWHKVLYDLGVVSTPEPFQRLVSQGMILGEVEYSVYKTLHGEYCTETTEGAETHRVDPADVEKKGEGYVLRDDPSVRVTARAHKMSKSRGNVINPDDIVWQYGADSLRLYEMFMGPLRETKVCCRHVFFGDQYTHATMDCHPFHDQVWNTQGVEGVHRFLARAFRLVTDQTLTDDPPTEEQLRLLHLTIKRVTEETEDLRFNTAISAMMEFVNGANKWPTRPRAALEPFVLLLAPYAPHLAEELWQVVQGMDTPQSCAYEAWPTFDPALLQESMVQLPVQVWGGQQGGLFYLQHTSRMHLDLQVNGKMRGTVQVPKGVDQAAALAAAQELPNVAKQVEGKDVKKVVFVVDKILNIIVGK